MSAPIDLAYVDAKALPRLRKLPAYSDPVDSKALALLGLEGVDGPEELRVARCLAETPPCDSASISEAIARAVSPTGRFLAPVLAVEGELVLSFDAIESLKLSVSAVLPFANGDDELTAAIAAARGFLDSPGGITPSSVAESLELRLRESFSRVRRAVPGDFVEREVLRSLVEQRRNKLATHAGLPHAHALLTLRGERLAQLCFVPKPALSFLPLTAKLDVRLLAEASPLAEPSDSQSFALRVVALGRKLGKI